MVTPKSEEYDAQKAQQAIEAERLGLLQNNAVEFLLKDSVPHDAEVVRHPANFRVQAAEPAPLPPPSRAT
jgi:hypothetical protein